MLFNTIARPVRCIFSISLTVLLAACGGSAGTSATSVPVVPVIVTPVVEKFTGLEILNFSNNETIRYSLPVLYGRAQAENTSVRIENAGKVYLVEAVEGYFKALIPMQSGVNDITVTAGNKSTNLRINYQAADNPLKVQMLYAIAADDDGHFVAEAGMDNSIAEAKKRIALEALIMQSVTAEMLYKGSKKRVTYALLEDGKGNPAIGTLRLPLTRAELYKKTDQELYQVIEQALRQANLFDNVKSMVTMGFSDYQAGKIVGHAALGGGNLGIFGALHLYACPATLEQVSASFLNSKLIDTRVLPEDNGGRSGYWAQCATGMGASLHELGHAFGLAHTPTGIMSRGFDNFNRVFMMREPGSTLTLNRENEAGGIWDPDSLNGLLTSPWFK